MYYHPFFLSLIVQIYLLDFDSKVPYPNSILPLVHPHIVSIPTPFLSLSRNLSTIHPHFPTRSLRNILSISLQMDPLDQNMYDHYILVLYLNISLSLLLLPSVFLYNYTSYSRPFLSISVIIYILAILSEANQNSYPLSIHRSYLYSTMLRDASPSSLSLCDQDGTTLLF